MDVEKMDAVFRAFFIIFLEKADMCFRFNF